MTLDPRRGIRRRYQSETLDPAMLLALQETGDDLAWLDSRRRLSPRPQLEVAEAIVRWSKENDDRRPRQGATDPDELKAAKDLSRLAMVARAGKLSDDADTVLIAQFGTGWGERSRRPDLEAAQDVVRWSTGNDDRRPSHGATDPDELKAAKDLSKLARKARAGELSEDADELVTSQFGLGWSDLQRKPGSTS